MTNNLFNSINWHLDSLTTKQVAEKLGITPRRVQALIEAGRLPALKIGRDYLIRPHDLRLVQDRKVGRPKRGIWLKLSFIT